MGVLQPTEPWWVYVLCCRDGSFYCGVTNDLQRRVDLHNAGKGARYTRGRLPVRVLHAWVVASKGAALREERAFKALNRPQKCARLKEWAPATK